VIASAQFFGHTESESIDHLILKKAHMMDTYTLASQRDVAQWRVGQENDDEVIDGETRDLLPGEEAKGEIIKIEGAPNGQSAENGQKTGRREQAREEGRNAFRAGVDKIKEKFFR
jgi:hypothetical protein